MSNRVREVNLMPCLHQASLPPHPSHSGATLPGQRQSVCASPPVPASLCVLLGSRQTKTLTAPLSERQSGHTSPVLEPGRITSVEMGPPPPPCDSCRDTGGHCLAWKWGKRTAYVSTSKHCGPIRPSNLAMSWQCVRWSQEVDERLCGISLCVSGLPACV